jgi:L-fuculose-phosphate aldolase
VNEANARADIVRFCGLLYDRRLVTGSSGNVSLLLDEETLLITPTQRSLRDLSSAEIVLADRRGVPRDSLQRPTSELPLHLAAYGARPDVGCVVHTHPTYCVVWSKTGDVFARDTVGARETLGEVAWTPYCPPGSSALAEITAVEFARGINVVLMERHGLSTIATTLENAFVLTDLAEEAARIAYFSRIAGLDDPR